MVWLRDLAPLLHQIADDQQYDRRSKADRDRVVLNFVLTLGKKKRFQRSRNVGCYLGLRPRRSQSGDSDPQLGITKPGNRYFATLLVECANHVIGPQGKNSSSRRWGLSLGAHCGSHARRRAVVAVARKRIASVFPRSLSSLSPSAA